MGIVNFDIYDSFYHFLKIFKDIKLSKINV